MHLDAVGAWDWLVTSPLFGIALTLAAYQLARRVWRAAGRNALANPVLVSIALIGGVLLLLQVDYGDYMAGGQYINFLLGPATVALALPLHREVVLIRQAVAPIVLGVVAGSVTAIVSAFWIVRALGGSHVLALSMAPKSATTPVSIALADTVGGAPALTAVFTVLAGVLGAVAGPRLLTLAGFRDLRARGLAIGVSSHGIGTARALEEDRTEGAFSGLALALNTLATATALPLLLLMLNR